MRCSCLEAVEMTIFNANLEFDCAFVGLRSFNIWIELKTYKWSNKI